MNKICGKERPVKSVQTHISAQGGWFITKRGINTSAVVADL